MRASSILVALALVALGACTVTEETTASPTTPPPPPATAGGTTQTPPPAGGTVAVTPVATTPATVVVTPVDSVPPDPPAPADGRYAIQLERPAVVGAATRFEARGEKRTHQRRQLAGGQPEDVTEVLAVRMTGVHRVLEIDAHGDISRAQIDVASFTAEGTGRPEPLVPAGSTIVVEIAERPAEGRFLLGGNPVTGRVREHLKILFSTTRDSTSDDDVFGTSRPRRAGESWSVTSAPMVRTFADLFVGLRAGDIRGRTTLHGVTQEAGRSYLDIGVDLSIRIRGMAGLPPGARVTRGSMTMRPRGLFSVTPGLPPPRERMEMESEFVMRVPTPGGAMTITMEITESREFLRSRAS